MLAVTQIRSIYAINHARNVVSIRLQRCETLYVFISYLNEWLEIMRLPQYFLDAPADTQQKILLEVAPFPRPGYGWTNSGKRSFKHKLNIKRLDIIL